LAHFPALYTPLRAHSPGGEKLKDLLALKIEAKEEAIAFRKASRANTLPGFGAMT
jgi:hypothetical protein